jgi:LacI family xylobiose transport system transcriptional regulator
VDRSLPPVGAAPAKRSSDGTRRGRRRGELTVATIAQLAGVSTPTVSRVLNGRSGVALETRRRIEALLLKHGYRRPDAGVPAASIEVVFYQLESHLAIQLLRGVESVARQHELAVGFTEAGRPNTAGRSWIDQLLARRPVGVIAVYSAFTPEQVAQLAVSGIPVVALDPTGEPLQSTPSVGITNWSGGISATRHLLELGHRRIGLIGGPADSLGARARLEGCRAAMDTAGLPLDERLFRVGECCFEVGQKFGRELLSLQDPPTAVLCGNDLQAFGVYSAASQLGLRIPHDLSVVGFDDIETTLWCCPPMTTVRQPIVAMGAAAASMVLALADNQPLPHPRIELATTLVVRESTAPPSRS